jgi:hypothetical protein
MQRKHATPRVKELSQAEVSVFLNVPYDPPFVELFLAYLAGISAFGLVPRATLEIPGSARRLDRIWSLIRGCRYSIHDLSRVELDATAPATPRFNMPFELGLAVAHEQVDKRHSWFVFETIPWRFQKSLSDLNGTEVYIHGGTTEGVFRELSAAFVRNDHQPSVGEMRRILDGLKQGMPKILRRAGTDTPFHARVFRELSVYASALTAEVSK